MGELHPNTITASNSTAVLAAEITDLRTAVKRLQKLLDRDHTGLAAALNAVRKLIGDMPPSVGWGWIPAGEWGCYEEHERSEKVLREEVGRCFDAIGRVCETALLESGVRAGAAFVPERDQLEALRDVLRHLERRADAAARLEEPAGWRHALEVLAEECRIARGE